jgi:prepilin-type N-terminal cleavage/methylation domain-containing protein
MDKKKNNKGFTLIEILIVISIIGLLSAATLIGLGGFRAQGRDARRLSDLRQIQNALELYYANNSVYPTDIYATGAFAGVNVGTIPHDPDGTTPYGYATCGGGYTLQTKLENANSSSFKDSVTSDPCNKLDCTSPNFCITF